MAAPHLGHALGTAHVGHVGELGSDAAGEAAVDPSRVLQQYRDGVVHTWGEAQDRGKRARLSCSSNEREWSAGVYGPWRNPVNSQGEGMKPRPQGTCGRTPFVGIVQYLTNPTEPESRLVVA